MFRQLSTVICSAFALSVFIVLPVLAEEITDYDVQVTVQTDGSLHVQEDITYDFGTLERHGIFREIPVTYVDSFQNKFSVDINNIAVTKSNGDSWNFAVRTVGRNKEIKVGDADILITGKHKYQLSYDVERAILHEKGKTVLLWNIIGNKWNVPITAGTLQILLPNTIPAGSVNGTCFRGEFSSTQTCGTIAVTRDAHHLIYTLPTLSLHAFEGITTNIEWPSGYIAVPTIWDNILWFLQHNWTYGLPVLVLIIMMYLWYTRGRDPKGQATIITQFSPPDGLSPAYVGLIIDEKVHTQDVSAEIIELAVHGFLKIIRLEKQGLFGKVDYELQLLKPSTGAPFAHQKLLLDELFESATVRTPGKPLAVTKLSSHTNTFHEKLAKIVSQIGKEAEQKGYFAKNPHQVRATYMVIGLFVLVLGIPFIDNPVVIGLNAGIVILFSFIMPAKTAKGVKAYQHIVGFKQYLSVAEKDRIQFHNAPEKSPEQFEKFLPYAMVLGVEKEWEKQFAGIYNPAQSTWFHGSPAAMTMAGFTRELSGLKSSMNTELSSKPSSSGSGGSSGGGFGGGGGGSW